MLVIQFITVYFYLPETRGATLEEINRTMGGQEAVDSFKSKALELDNFQSSSIMRTSIDKGPDYGVTHLEDHSGEKGNDGDGGNIRRRQLSADLCLRDEV